MTHEQKAHIAELLSLQAEISSKPLSQAAIIMLVESMADLPFESVKNLLMTWNKSNKGFPHPADIRAKIKPEIDLADNALDIANTILKCIGTCGYTNPARAQLQIGGLGWEVVKRMGGWQHLCETVTLQNEGIYRAQIKSYAETVAKKAKAGDIEAMPELPAANEETRKLIQATMKGIE